jgi:hypothetical protein
MKVICCVCGEEIGEIEDMENPPVEDPVSHGYCYEHYKEAMQEVCNEQEVS